MGRRRRRSDQGGAKPWVDYHLLSTQGRLPANLHMVTAYQPVLMNPIGIAVKKGNAELLARISKSQSKLMADGTLKAIFAKYGFDWTQPK